MIFMSFHLLFHFLANIPYSSIFGVLNLNGRNYTIHSLFSPEASWIDSQPEEVLSNREDPTSEFHKEESKIRFNAAKALEEFQSRS